jgi:hypothetical protein
VGALVYALIAAGTAGAAGEFEPNDGITQTAGPLSGGVDYTATYETENDRDWYRFYVRGQTQVTVRATAFPEPGDSDARCGFDLLNRSGESLDSTAAYEDEFSEINYTLFKPGIHYLEMYGCSDVGETYRFNVSPAASLVANDTCGQALTERGPASQTVQKLSEKLSKLKQRKAKANGRKAKQRLKVKIRATRGQFAGASAVLAEIDARIATHC